MSITFRITNNLSSTSDNRFFLANKFNSLRPKFQKDLFVNLYSIDWHLFPKLRWSYSCWVVALGRRPYLLHHSGCFHMAAWIVLPHNSGLINFDDISLCIKASIHTLLLNFSILEHQYLIIDFMQMSLTVSVNLRTWFLYPTVDQILTFHLSLGEQRTVWRSDRSNRNIWLLILDIHHSVPEIRAWATLLIILRSSHVWCSRNRQRNHWFQFVTDWFQRGRP